MSPKPLKYSAGPSRLSPSTPTKSQSALAHLEENYPLSPKHKDRRSVQSPLPETVSLLKRQAIIAAAPAAARNFLLDKFDSYAERYNEDGKIKIGYAEEVVHLKSPKKHSWLRRIDRDGDTEMGGFDTKKEVMTAWNEEVSPFDLLPPAKTVLEGTLPKAPAFKDSIDKQAAIGAIVIKKKSRHSRTQAQSDIGLDFVMPKIDEPPARTRSPSNVRAGSSSQEALNHEHEAATRARSESISKVSTPQHAGPRLSRKPASTRNLREAYISPVKTDDEVAAKVQSDATSQSGSLISECGMVTSMNEFITLFSGLAM